MLQGEVEDEDQDLRRQRRPEDGGAADPPQEEGDEEKSEHHAVEDRAHDVDGLDQVLRQVREQGEGDRDQAPERP